MIDSIISTLRKSIARSKLPIESVAQKANVPLEALSALLERRQPISTAQLSRIADVLQLEPVALLQGREQPTPLAEIFFRQTAWQDFDHRDMDVLGRALEGARALRELRALLGLPSLRERNGLRPRAVPGRTATEAAKDGDQLARRIRTLLGKPNQPLGDLRMIIESQLGVPVFVCSMRPASGSALSVRAANDLATGAIVLANNERHRPSATLPTRVDLAHELCHLFFDPTSRTGIHLVIDRDESHTRSGRAEQRARAFAAELLMPRAALRPLYGEPRHLDSQDEGEALVRRAVLRFGATWRVTTNHLHDAGYLSDELRTELEANPRRIEPPPEFAVSLPRPDGPSLLVAELARKAHEHDLINDGDARSLLGIPIDAPIPWDEQSE